MVPHAGSRTLCIIQTASQVNADTVTEYHPEGLLRRTSLLALVDEDGAAVK